MFANIKIILLLYIRVTVFKKTNVLVRTLFTKHLVGLY